MEIRPKVGARVGFKSWQMKPGKEVPPHPWTGEVVEVILPRYFVRRDADGEVVPIWSAQLYYIQEQKRPSRYPERR